MSGVIVLAYHEMGCAGLRVLLRRGVEVKAVFTYEDSPGENIWFGSVAALARAHDVPVEITEGVNDAEWVEHIRALGPDVLFRFSYRHIIKKALRAIPPLGCVNLHGSLLPKYRGRCPVNWQLVHGETLSGVTLHDMVGRADAGDIIGQEAVPVGPEDTAIDVYMNLLPAAERLLDRHLEDILAGTALRTAQDESLATVFGGRRPEDGRLDWSRPASELHNLVRAVAPPWPGAAADLADGPLLITRSRPHGARPELGRVAPGEIVFSAGVPYAGTGHGLLELVTYEAPGGRRLRPGEVAVARAPLGAKQS